MDTPTDPRPPAAVADPARATPSTQPSALVEMGPTPPDRDIPFELVLAFPGDAAMQAYAQSVSDPRSPDYRRFLTAAEIGARFGLGDDKVGRVIEWAAAHGIKVVEMAPQRIAIEVAAPAGIVATLFGVTMRDYADAAGRIFHAPTGTASVPDAIAGLVSDVGGLDGRPSKHPAFSGPIAAGPSGGMKPPIIDRLYELEGLRSQDLHGEGQTVAIVSLDGFDPADVAQFDKQAGVSGPPVERIKVRGGIDAPGDDQVEVDLDIDVIRAVAPKAQILDYEAPNEDGAIEAIVDQIVKDGRADIVSISWGSCEAGETAATMARTAKSFAAAATRGISIFVASGDHGAYDCMSNARTDLRISVDSPSSDVNAIGVGGTYAWMREDGTYIDEVGWEEPLTAWATGGGLSTYYDRPAWQVGAGVDNARSNGKRQVPDVSAAADSTSGWLSVSEGDGDSEGGTSSSSPFWAGFAVLVRQLAEREGVTGLGQLNKVLYEVAAAQPAGALFHDVTRGGNLHDDATSGWDYGTGLGTPRGTPLARAIVDQVKGP
jgi:kumamolisin